MTRKIDRSRGPRYLCFALWATILLTIPTLADESQSEGDYYGDPLPKGAVARLGTIRFRHGGDIVSQMHFSPDDKVLASAGKDRVVRIWDAANGRQLQRLEGHEGEVWDLTFFSTGDRLASVSWLPTASNDQSLRIWDLTSGQLLRRVNLPGNGSPSVVVSPDGNTVATARPDGDVDLWDVNSGERLRTESMASVPVRSLAFLNNGNTLASGSIYEKTTQPGFVFTLLHSENTRHKQTFKFRLNSRTRTSEIDPRTGAGCRLSISADENTVAVSSNDGVVRFFDVPTRAFTHEISGLPNTTMSLSPDGRFVASGHQGISLRDRTKVEQARDFWTANTTVTAVDFSHDGEQLVAATDTGVIRLWDLESGDELIQPGPTHDRWVKAIAFSPNGKSVVTGGMDDRLRCWDVATGRQIWDVPTRTNVLASTVLEFTPDGSEILLCMRHNREVEFFDVEDGEKTRTISTSVHGDVLDLSPDQRYLVLARANNGVELVDLETSVKRQAGKGSRIRMDAVAIAPDGNTVATASRSGGRKGEPVVRLWDMDQKKDQIRELMAPGGDDNKVYGADYVCFSPNGQYVAAASQQAILVWDVSSGRLLQELPSTGNRMWPIAISPDSNFLATCLGTEVVLYELATGEEVTRFAGHETYLTCIVFHPDGRHLASGAWDGSTLVWDLSTLADDLYSQTSSPEESFDEHWQMLSDFDSNLGQTAVWALVRQGEDAVAMFRQRLQPQTLPVIDEEELAMLLSELEDDRYDIRERAMDKLAELGDAALPHYEAVLQETPSLELRSRVTRLMREQEESLYEIDADELVVLRAIQALEQIGTEPARQLLEHLATGDLERLTTKASQAALQRLEHRIRKGIIY